AKFFRELNGQEEDIVSGGDATADGIVGVIKEELGENRDGEARLPGVVETPLDAGIGLTHTKFSRGIGTLDAQPGIFVSELDAIADAEIDVDVRGVRDGLVAVEKGHVGDIDFPIEIAGRTRIIGVVGRTALATRGGGSKEEGEHENWYPQHSYGAKGAEQKGHEGPNASNPTENAVTLRR